MIDCIPDKSTWIDPKPAVYWTRDSDQICVDQKTGQKWRVEDCHCGLLIRLKTTDEAQRKIRSSLNNLLKLTQKGHSVDFMRIDPLCTEEQLRRMKNSEWYQPMKDQYKIAKLEKDEKEKIRPPTTYDYDIWLTKQYLPPDNDKIGIASTDSNDNYIMVGDNDDNDGGHIDSYGGSGGGGGGGGYRDRGRGRGNYGGGYRDTGRGNYGGGYRDRGRGNYGGGYRGGRGGGGYRGGRGGRGGRSGYDGGYNYQGGRGGHGGRSRDDNY